MYRFAPVCFGHRLVIVGVHATDQPPATRLQTRGALVVGQAHVQTGMFVGETRLRTFILRRSRDQERTGGMSCRAGPNSRPVFAVPGSHRTRLLRFLGMPMSATTWGKSCPHRLKPSPQIPSDNIPPEPTDIPVKRKPVCTGNTRPLCSQCLPPIPLT